MSRRSEEEVQQGLQAIGKALDQLDRRTEKMETILLVRDPGSSAAAEAYDGLRKQVVSAISDHLARLTQLVQMDFAIRRGADVTVLQTMVEGWFESAGLVRVSSTEEDQTDLLYELVEDLGGSLEVLDVAYVESATGRVIRQGRARRGAPVASVATEPAASPGDHEPDPAVATIDEATASGATTTSATTCPTPELAGEATA